MVHWIRRHARRMARYAGAQVIFQIINALTGFILVRAMPKNDYAWFTITNSLLATIGILADSGLGSATTSMGGALIGDPVRFAGLIRATRRLRFIFVFGAGAVTLPAGWWVLQHNHASKGVTITLLIVTLVTALFAAESVVLNTVNRLHTKLRLMAQSDFALSGSRLIFILGSWWAGLTVVLAVLSTAASQWAQALLLRRQTRERVLVEDSSDTDWNPEVMKVVRHMFPLCVFTCVQGNLITWLLSMLGTTNNVADVGALARFSVVFTFLSIPMAQVIAPAIARCQDTRRLQKLCLAVVGGFTAMVTIMVILGSLFSTQLLWVLGQKYSHLHTELTWFLVYQAVGLVSTVMWGVVLTRSWVRHGWVLIPLTIGLQALAVLWLDLSQVINALLLSGISSITGILVCGWLIFRGLREHDARAASSATP